MQVGIVGCGKMGKMLRVFLEKAGLRVYLCSGERSSLQKLWRISDIIILATSLKEIKNTLEEILKIAMMEPRKVLVMDIATFKSDLFPIYSLFPKEVEVASIHPMFGVGVRDLKGQLFLVVPIEGRERGAKSAANFIKSLDGEIQFVESAEHDRLIGFTVGVPYFIGLSYLSFSIERALGKYGGTSHKFLTLYGKFVLNDSPEFIREVIYRSRKEIDEFISFLQKREETSVFEKISEKISIKDIKEAYERLCSIL